MTDSSSHPTLANAQVSGGGGHEPDPDEHPAQPVAPANTGSGVDLKSENLPETED
jgi:hypothetical protein